MSERLDGREPLTIVLPERLVRRAEVEARRVGQPVESWIAELVAVRLAERREPARRE
jgi:hypothetical protein